MGAACRHVEALETLDPPEPVGEGCVDCLALGRHNWVHLRLCQACGHVGCCDNSPGRHATAHFGSSDHPLIRSFEPDEDWWWCYADDLFLEVPGAPPSPSHP